MFKIGEFSKLTQISGRMLRHFDKLELLTPKQIDDNGYRLYSSYQLQDALRITSLQRAGFQLQEIKRMMSDDITNDELQQIIKTCRQRKEMEYKKVKKELSMLDDIDEILSRGTNIHTYTLELKHIPRHIVASLRQRIPKYSDEGMLWGKMMSEIMPQQPKFSNSMRKLAIYHDEEYMEEDPDVEIRISVDNIYKDTKHVTFKEVDEEEVLTITFHGSYEQIGNVNAEAIRRMEQNGYELDGKFYCVYLNGPEKTKESEKWTTECCFPVKKL